MQTCSLCYTQSPNSALTCQNCKADLRELSTTAVALLKLKSNPRVLNIRLVVDDDACPACQEFSGTYQKENVPRLPVEGCSSPHGCRCFYEPMLTEIFP
ncbi:MAG: hypothetical protein AB1453_15175 [Chloroflexota bacterium]